MSNKKMAEGIKTGQATVGITATLIAPAGNGREAITIVNGGAVDVFLGNASVSITTGILLAGVKGQTLTLYGTDAVYGIVASGTQVVSYADNN